MGVSKRDEAVRRAAERRQLSKLDTLRLILRTYAVSLPYILLFIAGMLIATWFVTEILFR